LLPKSIEAFFASFPFSRCIFTRSLNSNKLIDINAPRILDYPEDLRSCIKEDYAEETGDLPLKGGWGYTADDAIVIDTGDPILKAEKMIYRVSDIPELVVEFRIYYELVNMREPNDQYAGIKWKLIDMKPVSEGGRKLHQYKYEITAHRAEDYEALRLAYDKGRLEADWDKDEHFAMHDELMRRYIGEFWMEVL